MDHSYFIDRLSAYHDRDLPPYELEVVREHLESCEECRKQLEKYQQLDEMIEKKSRLDESDYWEKSASKIEQALGSTATEVVDIKPTKSFGMVWKLAAVAASIAALTFISLHRSDIEEPVLEHMSPAMVAPVPVDEITGRTDDTLNQLFDEFDTKKEASKELRDDSNLKDAFGEDEDAEKRSLAEAELEFFEVIAPKKIVSEKSHRAQAPSFAAPEPTDTKPAEPQVKLEGIAVDGDAVRYLKEEKAKSAGLGEVSSEQFSLSAPQKVAPPPKAAQSLKVTAQKDFVKLAPAIADSLFLDESFLKLRLLRDQRDSLRSAIADYGTRRYREGVVPDSVEVLKPLADSSYNVMLDSMISTVYQIGLLSNDTLEINRSIKFLRNFPWNTTGEQRDRINDHLEKLRLKLD